MNRLDSFVVKSMGFEDAVGAMKLNDDSIGINARSLDLNDAFDDVFFRRSRAKDAEQGLQRRID